MFGFCGLQKAKNYLSFIFPLNTFNKALKAFLTKFNMLAKTTVDIIKSLK